jgi:methionyl-tRNA formyltransferase
MQPSNLKIAFFGTPLIAVTVLDELKKHDILPHLIVTNPDRKQGRGLVVTPSPAKLWAEKNNIAVCQPENLTDKDLLVPLTSEIWDLFIVVAYGNMMPSWLIELPKYKTLNVHPSLLPKLRGASPIRTAILEQHTETGVTIMLMDAMMDHGPILAQTVIQLKDNVRGATLDQTLAELGGTLLAETIPKWISGEVTPLEQKHEMATFSKKLTKDMGNIEIDPFDLPQGREAQAICAKINAFDGNPGTFFFCNDKRVKILEAHIENDKLYLDKVIPEGKKEMSFTEFLKSISQ